MKCTKEQLAGMSDFNLLKILYSLLGYEVIDYEFHEVLTIRKGKKVTTVELSCEDIMPLAFEHDITYVKSSECAYHKLRDCAYGFDYGQSYEDKNPLRAIACCLILVLQEKGA